MENQIFINSTKASSKPIDSVGIYLGKVMRVASNGDVFVKIPSLSRQVTFGPCKRFTSIPQLNDYVSVTFFDNRFDEPIIIGISSNDLTVTGTVTAGNVISHPTPIEQTASLTLDISHDGQILLMSNSSSAVITVPPETSVPFSLGTQITIIRYLTPAVSVAAVSPAIVSATPGFNLRARYSVAQLLKVESDRWILMGDLAV